MFIFTMPDRMGAGSFPMMGTTAPASASSEPGPGDDTGRQRVGIPVQALQVRKAGTGLIATAGGHFIHPVKAVGGGVWSWGGGGPGDAGL